MTLQVATKNHLHVQKSSSSSWSSVEFQNLAWLTADKMPVKEAKSLFPLGEPHTLAESTFNSGVNYRQLVAAW